MWCLTFDLSLQFKFPIGTGSSRCRVLIFSWILNYQTNANPSRWQTATCPQLPTCTGVWCWRRRLEKWHINICGKQVPAVVLSNLLTISVLVCFCLIHKSKATEPRPWLTTIDLFTKQRLRPPARLWRPYIQAGVTTACWAPPKSSWTAISLVSLSPSPHLTFWIIADSRHGCIACFCVQLSPKALCTGCCVTVMQGTLKSTGTRTRTCQRRCRCYCCYHSYDHRYDYDYDYNERNFDDDDDDDCDDCVMIMMMIVGMYIFFSSSFAFW